MKIKGVKDFKKKSKEEITKELKKLKNKLYFFTFFLFIYAGLSLTGVYFLTQELLQNQKVLNGVFLGIIIGLLGCMSLEEAVKCIYKRIVDDNELLMQMEQNENETNFRLEYSEKEMIRERKLEIV